MTLSARIGATGLLTLIALCFDGCGPSRRPSAVPSSYVQVGPSQPGDAERIERALRAWDAAGWPALTVRVSLLEPDPNTIPPACYGCDPSFLVTSGQGQPGSGGHAIAATYPGAVIACTRGQEWALAHELLHVLHQAEGRAPETHVSPATEDPRWAPVNALRDQLRAAWAP